MAWPVATRGHGMAAPPAPGGGDSYSYVNVEAALVVAAMSVEPDDTRKALIDDLVGDLKTAGVWTKMDLLYVMAAHDAQAARVNWKDPGTHDLTAVNSPTFTTDVGYKGNGTSAYLDPAWIAGTHASQFTAIANHLGARVDAVPTSGNKRLWGFRTSGAPLVAVAVSTDGTDIWASLNDLTGSQAAWNEAGDVVAGNMLAVRTGSGATDKRFYMNGSDRGAPNNSGDVADSSLSTENTDILRQENSFSASSFNIQAAHLGASLNATEAGNINTALNTYMATL